MPSLPVPPARRVARTAVKAVRIGVAATGVVPRVNRPTVGPTNRATTMAAVPVAKAARVGMTMVPAAGMAAGTAVADCTPARARAARGASASVR